MFKSPLTAGGYKVTWKAMSKDGHVVNGTIAFTVGGTQ
jgi:methionine-rich copper-binding protein CopC